MQPFARIALVLGLILIAAGPVLASESPLFVNLTTDTPHRAQMALIYGSKQLERGHPLTVWLNDKGVYLASKSKSGDFAEQQKLLGELVAKGATIIVCPMCMKHYGVSEADLIPGIKLGDPDLTGAALFKDDTKTLSW
jgi:sulfur relay (sulfurtransferase) complex TusBCD TusD component (DsrE family)